MTGRIQSSNPNPIRHVVASRSPGSSTGVPEKLLEIANTTGGEQSLTTFASTPAKKCPPAPPPRPVSVQANDDDGWGSDFDDVCYTAEEQGEFDARFQREDGQIAAAQRNWWGESVTPRFSSGGGGMPR